MGHGYRIFRWTDSTCRWSISGRAKLSGHFSHINRIPMWVTAKMIDFYNKISWICSRMHFWKSWTLTAVLFKLWRVISWGRQQHLDGVGTKLRDDEFADVCVRISYRYIDCHTRHRFLWFSDEPLWYAFSKQSNAWRYLHRCCICGVVHPYGPLNAI